MRVSGRLMGSKPRGSSIPLNRAFPDQMRQGGLLGGILGLLILLSSSVAVASPWRNLTTGDQVFLSLLLVVYLLSFPLLPHTLIAGDACYRFGVSAWTIQVSIILMALITAAIWLRRERWRGRKRLGALVVLYVILTFGTNVAAYTWFQVDHSGEHRIAVVLGEHLNPSRLA